MALFLDKLNATQRGKQADLLVFGYIHSQQNSMPNDINFPDDITIECLRYYFINHEWDPNGFAEEEMELDADNNIMKCTVASEKSAYLVGIIENKGIQIFRFKISNMKLTLWRQTIGLWKMNNDEEEPPFSGDFCTVREGSIAIANTGNTIVSGSYSTLSYNGCSGFTTGDIVDMIIDFEKNEVRFKINGKDYGKAGELDRDNRYRVAVCMLIPGDAIQLIS